MTFADPSTITADNPRETAANVARTGWSLWRGLYPADLIASALAAIEPNIDDPNAYDSPVRGTMSLDVFGYAAKRQLLTDALADALYRIVGGVFYLEQSHSPIFVMRVGKRPWVWHQDACVMPENGGCVWIALTECGVTAPGLAMALWGGQRKHPEFATDDLEQYAAREASMAALGVPVVAPAFQPGDAVFFNAYSIHKTHVTPDMPGQRIALRLTAFRAPS